MNHRASGSSYSSSRMSMSSSNFSRASTSSRSYRSSRTSQIRVAERVRNSIRRISTVFFEAPKDKNKGLGTLDESIEDNFAPATQTLTITKMSVLEQDVTGNKSLGCNVVGQDILGQDVLGQDTA
ncbi:hypothetical protein ACHWQZ_G004927 [Mnemiopsis leidyi]